MPWQIREARQWEQATRSPDGSEKRRNSGDKRSPSRPPCSSKVSSVSRQLSGKRAAPPRHLRQRDTRESPQKCGGDYHVRSQCHSSFAMPPVMLGMHFVYRPATSIKDRIRTLRNNFRKGRQLVHRYPGNGRKSPCKSQALALQLMTLTNLLATLAGKHRDIDAGRNYFGTMPRDSLLEHELIELLGIRDNIVGKPRNPVVEQPGPIPPATPSDE